MEADTVALIDYDGQQIRFYGKINRVISFQDAFILPHILDEDILYITNGDIVSSEDICNIVSELTIPNFDEPEKKFIHTTLDGYTKISDVGITFAGPRDARALDKLGLDIFARSAILKELYTAGKINIITETQAKALKKPLPNQNMRDIAISSILLDKPVDKALDEIGKEGDIFTDENEISSEGPEEVSETEQIMKRIGGFKN